MLYIGQGGNLKHTPARRGGVGARDCRSQSLAITHLLLQTSGIATAQHIGGTIERKGVDVVLARRRQCQQETGLVVIAAQHGTLHTRSKKVWCCCRSEAQGNQARLQTAV